MSSGPRPEMNPVVERILSYTPPPPGKPGVGGATNILSKFAGTLKTPPKKKPRPTRYIRY